MVRPPALGLHWDCRLERYSSIHRAAAEEIAEYFNVNAVTQANPGTYGNLGRNVLVGPGYANTDAALFRNIPLPLLGEQGRLTLRGEAFNLFNRPNLANPGTSIGSSTFGKITSVAGPPRILQFSLKILF